MFSESRVQALESKLESLGTQLKQLILGQDPKLLLGFLWGQLLMGVSVAAAERPNVVTADDGPILYALEYAHAVWSSEQAPEKESGTLDESTAYKILAVSEELRTCALHFATFSSGSKEGKFGVQTGRVEFAAKSNWVTVRGYRYPVLESEFFNYVLAPHEAALKQAYGVGAAEIAKGIQNLAEAMRSGIYRAYEGIEEERKKVEALAKELSLSEGDALNQAIAADASLSERLHKHQDDIFCGGICNATKHSGLPDAILKDLGYVRGEATEFFEPGPLCGTPLRTLPARVKPLVLLNDGYYATDPSFVRDAAYRAIQRGVTRRTQDTEGWNKRQKLLTEKAFFDILQSQLDGAEVLEEVYYRDVKSGQWVENDTLIIFEDILLQIEAKAGISTLASPASNLDSHFRAVQNLVVNAYTQTKRMLDYLASAAEVPLYKRTSTGWEEVRRIQLSEYRVVIPIGLTIESFAPFSALCKELPDVEPLLGKWPFISMSVDDLFVIRRLLRTPGELCHYLEVRQQAAGIKGLSLYDEFDHLGAYIEKNRFDLTAKEQLERANLVVWDRFSDIIDNYFFEDRWLSEAPPSQYYPPELASLFDALQKSRSPGWLAVDSLIRNADSRTRSGLAENLKRRPHSTEATPFRYFFSGTNEAPICFWLQAVEGDGFDDILIFRAQATALAMGRQSLPLVHLTMNPYKDGLMTCVVKQVAAPSPMQSDYAELLEASKNLSALVLKKANEQKARKPRPNEPCWCGSGKKFKKCHNEGM